MILGLSLSLVLYADLCHRTLSLCTLIFRDKRDNNTITFFAYLNARDDMANNNYAKLIVCLGTLEYKDTKC